MLTWLSADSGNRQTHHHVTEDTKKTTYLFQCLSVAL